MDYLQNLNLARNNIRSKKTGCRKNNILQQKIKKKNTGTLHCLFCDCLNFLVKNVAKLSFDTIDFVVIVQELCNYFSALENHCSILQAHLPDIDFKVTTDKCIFFS